MKSRLFFFVTIIFFSAAVFSAAAVAQVPGDYFPATLGNSWHYSQYELDTLQNLLPATKIAVTDSLTAVKSIGGFTGTQLVRSSKSGRDTLVLRADASSIYLSHPGLIFTLSSSSFRFLVDSLGFIALMNRNTWFPYLEFSTATGVADTIIRVDTTIDYNGGPLQIMLRLATKRLSSKSVTVPAGSFTAVPFVISLAGNGSITSPISTYRFNLLRMYDTLYVVNKKWIVKEVQASAIFPYETLPVDDVPRYVLAGFSRVLESSSIVSVPFLPVVPSSYQTMDNFPNPFNPSTEITYHTASDGVVTIAVYDMLGREVSLLVHEWQQSGEHAVRWQADRQSSGAYVAVLTCGGVQTIRKITVQK